MMIVALGVVHEVYYIFLGAEYLMYVHLSTRFDLFLHHMEPPRRCRSNKQMSFDPTLHIVEAFSL
jgi:hypothetical protein